MKGSQSVALLAAGRIRDSFLRKLPRLREKLGPVCSSSYRLASRIANLLGAGRPEENLAAFANSKMILVSMPEPWLPGVVDRLAQEVHTDWKTKTILLCDSQLDNDVLAKLAGLGAATGSISTVPAFGDGLYVLEGDRRALRSARQFVETPGVKIITMDPQRKALFSAGISFATTLALPLLTASVESLRACGIEQNEAVLLADTLLQRTVRTYVKAGRKGWEGALPAQDITAIRRQVKALFQRSPVLASYYYENALQVVRMFRKDPAWLSELRGDVYPKVAG